MKKPADRQQIDAEIQQIIELRHPDPHRVLGIHPEGDGVVVRTFRPDAAAIHVLPDFGGRIAMEHRKGGVFEARINGRDQVFSYLIEVEYPGGKVFTLRDPYSFTPTLGELDLYYAGEGRHEKLWERMGAHLHPPPRGGRACPSRCGRPRRPACPWWATSTAGMAACTPCGAWAPRASGSCSSPRWARALATSSRSAPTMAARRCSRRTRSPSAPRCPRPPRPWCMICTASRGRTSSG